MSDPDAFQRFAAIAQKWRELADRRRDDFTDLYQSGRWKRYYSEADLVMRMREVVTVAERWSAIAPPPPDAGKTPANATPVISALRRTAA